MLDDGEQIRLERSGCGFVCPAYRLSLYTDGAVRFTGRAHTGVIGERSSQIDAGSLKALTEKLTASLPAVAGRYVPGEKNCGQMMTDQATMKLAVRVGDGVVDSTRYGGCMGAPEKLAELENLVDAATRSEQWVSRNPTS